jgi:hypothetical protein
MLRRISPRGGPTLSLLAALVDSIAVAGAREGVVEAVVMEAGEEGKS